jgi:hypothetical protein
MNRCDDSPRPYWAEGMDEKTKKPIIEACKQVLESLRGFPMYDARHIIFEELVHKVMQQSVFLPDQKK